MRTSDQACFGYRIRPSGGGWAWTTFDLDGQVEGEGWAPHKALAAACIVRALAQAAVADPERAAA